MFRFALVLALCSIVGCATAPPQRVEADIVRDAASQPVAVLDFFGVRSGWTVLDLFAGSGYYSELLSARVGRSGTVYLHNNRAYLNFTKGLDERLAGDRLPNVIRYDREIGDIDLPEGSVDMALLVLTYHDVYYETEGWDVTAEPLFAALRRVLKVGGTLAIVDHHAAAGTGKQHAQDLHRIDAAFARRDIESRGFRFVDALNVLENDSDDLTKSVFDPEVRRKTSRFVYRFERR